MTAFNRPTDVSRVAILTDSGIHYPLVSPFFPIYRITLHHAVSSLHNIKDRNAYELKIFGSKKARKDILTKEAVKMFQSKNPTSDKMYSLKEIGVILGNRKETAIWKLLRDAGIKTRRGRNYTGSKKDEQ